MNDKDDDVHDYGVRSLNGSMLEMRPLIGDGGDTSMIKHGFSGPAEEIVPIDTAEKSGASSEGSTIGIIPIPIPIRTSSNLEYQAHEREDDDLERDLSLSTSQTLTPGPNFRPDPFDRDRDRGTVTIDDTHVRLSLDKAGAEGTESEGSRYSLNDGEEAKAEVEEDPGMGMGMIMPDGNEFSFSSSRAVLGQDKDRVEWEEGRVGFGGLPMVSRVGAGVRGGGQALWVTAGDEASPAAGPSIHHRPPPSHNAQSTRSNSHNTQHPSPPFSPLSSSSVPTPTSSTTSMTGSFSLWTLSASTSNLDSPTSSAVGGSRGSSPSPFGLSDTDTEAESVGRNGRRSAGRARGVGTEVANPSRGSESGVDSGEQKGEIPVERGRSGTIVPKLLEARGTTSLTTSNPDSGPALGTQDDRTPRRSAQPFSTLRPSPMVQRPPNVVAYSSSTANPGSRPTTKQYAYSRSHWAVEEARQRSEQQGDQLSIEIPDLPDGYEFHHLIGPSSASSSTSPDRARRTRDAERRPLAFLLCGTNRTTNAFLRAIELDGRVDLFVLPSPTSRKAKGKESVGRGMRSDGRYRVGMFANPTVESPSPRARRSSRRLLGTIQVIGKGQLGNVQRALAAVEATYERLDRLLKEHAVGDDDSEWRGRDDVDPDLARLVALWIAGDVGGSQHDSLGPDRWYDLCIVTGDARHLESRDSFDLDRLVASVPSVCYPQALSARLLESLSLQITGYATDSMPRTDDGAAELIDMVWNPRSGGQGLNLRDVQVEAFLEWRKAKASQPAGQSSESSAGMASQILPLPTLASVAHKGEARADWEAGLSRRHAAMHQRKARRGVLRIGGSARDPGPHQPARSVRSIPPPALFNAFVCQGTVLSGIPTIDSGACAPVPRMNISIIGMLQRLFAPPSASPDNDQQADVSNRIKTPVDGKARTPSLKPYLCLGIGLGIATAGWLCWSWLHES